jgi:hypothetical protein
MKLFFWLALMVGGNMVLEVESSYAPSFIDVVSSKRYVVVVVVVICFVLFSFSGQASNVN